MPANPQISHARYHPQARLLTWHPHGVFDDDVADRAVEFVESNEQTAGVPFHRYADFCGLTEIRLTFGHALQIGEHRRTTYAGRARVKSAFFCEWPVGFGIARTSEELMERASIEVRAFRAREAAAEWLGVPEDILNPPKLKP
jgi:hypothetical protein